MKEGYIVLMPNEDIIQLDNLNNVVLTIQEFNKKIIEEYCDDYEIEYDDMSKNEMNFASGYSVGMPRVFKTEDVVDIIKKSDIIQCEKDSLISKFKLTEKTINLEDYPDLEDILDECDEIAVENYLE